MKFIAVGSDDEREVIMLPKGQKQDTHGSKIQLVARLLHPIRTDRCPGKECEAVNDQFHGFVRHGWT